MRKRLLRRDDGMTLMELMVVMSIFSFLMVLVFGVMIQVMYMSKDNMGRVSSAENARLGLSQIDRQVRSGSVILDPADEPASHSGVDPFYSLRIFTQEGGTPKCAQWRVIDADGDGTGVLEYREWSPDYPVISDVTDWGVVAHQLVVTDLDNPQAGDSSTWPPFWKDASAMVESDEYTPAQNIRITLHVKDENMRDSAKPVTISTVVTGRNTVMGYSESNCSIIPAA